MLAIHHPLKFSPIDSKPPLRNHPSIRRCIVWGVHSVVVISQITSFSAASDVEGRSLCNHRRAYKFFTDSVSPRCHFPSFPCESYDKFMEGDCFPCIGDRHCGNMGYYADRSNGRGTLFLITREEEPFCGRYQISILPELCTPADEWFEKWRMELCIQIRW